MTRLATFLGSGLTGQHLATDIALSLTLLALGRLIQTGGTHVR